MATAPPSGERYLRRLVEAVLDPYDDGREDDVRTAASALVTAGAVDGATADDLVDDLALAVALRGDKHGHLPLRSPRRHLGDRPDRLPLPPCSVAVGPARVELPDGVVLGVSVTFDATGATLRQWGLPHEPPAWATTPATATGPRPPGRPARPPGAPAAHAAGPAKPKNRLDASHAAGPAKPKNRLDASHAVRLRQLRDDRGGRYLAVGGSSGHDGDTWTAAAPLQPGPDPGVAWFEVGPPGSPLARLVVHPPGPAVSGRPHGRSPGAHWVLGAIAARSLGLRSIAGMNPGVRNLTPPGVRNLTPGVRALLAVAALDPTDPLVHQAQLMDLAGDEADPGLDPRWRSAIARRHEPPVARGAWPIGIAVDLGDLAVRLDSFHADESGARLLGAASPWVWRSRAIPAGGPVMTAFDDRHNWYGLHVGEAAGRPGQPTEVTWRLAPALDPTARSLRIDLTGPRQEASVEVTLG